ncbi:MAG: ATP-binding protein [Chloroflexota bacterium]|nr:ATP-binding protein [Chloroflexota bacterium]
MTDDMTDESTPTPETGAPSQPEPADAGVAGAPERRGSNPLSADSLNSARDFVAGLGPRLLQSRRKISTQLYVAFAVIVALTLLATIVGWFSFDRVANAQRHVNDESIPEMVAAFEVAQYSNSLVTAAPRIVTAQTVVELDQTYAYVIAGASNALEVELAELERTAPALDPHLEEFSFQEIREGANLLTSNIKTLRNQRTELIVQAEKRANLREELSEVRRSLEINMTEALDDQLFYVVTGYYDIDLSPHPEVVHASPREIDKYRLLSELQVDGNIATELMASAFAVTEAASLEPLRERFEAAMNRIGFNLASLEGTETHDDLVPIFENLEKLGVSEGTGFNLLAEELRLAQRQAELLESNQESALDLVGEVDELVTIARATASEATEASLQAILTGRTFLLVISLTSVVVAALVAWLLVGRVLLRRIGMVSAWMRRMAAGDLEAQVDVGGHDEVADMAAAVEVFRLHALEVQRLNLVELLAGDLQEKNDELQAAFEELRRAQDQIVTQQKLASLGELTAGVAHEIRNPLNFVKNFSESSVELLSELQEVLEEAGENLSEEQKGLIQEISDDLHDNMDRIQNHGDRANRIVHDMLMMSRGSGEFQMVDINRLVDEHSRLAFHSARATDSEFQLDLQYDLDPEMGELEVIPQDLGRVFLNMVSNSCYATNEKRKILTEKGESYFPTLLLSTRRNENDMEISIRDNGSGMPQDVIDKIFNPFFTTKPTDQGTGLGLAISSDIVREHGGSITVTSEPDEYTQMVVQLPLVKPIISIDENGAEGEVPESEMPEDEVPEETEQESTVGS